VSEPPPIPALMAQALADSWVGSMLIGTNEYAVIGLSLEARIIGWHGAATRLFGYTADEIANQPFARLFTPPDVERGLPEVELELARQTGRSEDDRWHRRKDGGRFWSSGVVNRLFNQDKVLVGYVKVLRDRTDLHTRFEALRNRLERMTQQLADERRLRATLLHELRNPLVPILNAAHIIDTQADEETRRRMLAVIARQTEVLQRVLDEATAPVLPVAQLRLRPITLQDAVRQAVDALRHSASAKALSLVFVCPDAPVTIEADSARLQQMVHNLLSNALKYTTGGGHVTVAVTVEGDMAVVRVDDDGTGIAKENLERVFELFTREENDDAVPGVGVGLAVVKQLAQLHGGFVEARSPGKGLGSQFTLQLPLNARRTQAD